MQNIRSARRMTIHASYQEYQKALMPAQWKYLPRTLDICALDPFAAVLDATAEVAVTAADLEDAFRQLPELLAASSDALKLHARSLIKMPTSTIQPASTAQELGDMLEGEAASPSSSIQPAALDLAASAFTCQEPICKRSYLFGWDAIAQHHCRLDLDSFDSVAYGWEPHWMDLPPDPPKIAFNTRGSEIAGTIVRAAGFDDRVATPLDMDAKDLRFGCSTCPPNCPPESSGTSSWTKVGYKWRDFVCFLPFFFLFFFSANNFISSRSYIVMSNRTPQRLPSSCSLHIL